MDELEKHLAILEGLEDVAAGRTLPHAQVQTWTRSLVVSARELSSSEGTTKDQRDVQAPDP